MAANCKRCQAPVDYSALCAICATKLNAQGVQKRVEAFHKKRLKGEPPLASFLVCLFISIPAGVFFFWILGGASNPQVSLTAGTVVFALLQTVCYLGTRSQDNSRIVLEKKDKDALAKHPKSLMPERVEATTAQSPPPADGNLGGRAERGVLKCGGCSSVLETSAKFCPECGHRMAEPEPSIVVPKPGNAAVPPLSSASPSGATLASSILGIIVVGWLVCTFVPFGKPFIAGMISAIPNSEPVLNFLGLNYKPTTTSLTPSSPTSYKVSSTLDELKVGDWQVFNDERRPYISGTIANTTGQDYSYVQVTFDLFDGSGAVIGTANDIVGGLKDGTTWRFKARVHRDSVADVQFQKITAF